MRTSIATVSLSGTWMKSWEAIAAASFDGVEIFENDLLAFNGRPAEIRNMAEALGLKVVTFQPFRDFEGMPADKRTRVFQRAERKFDAMQELGCDLLMICSNVSPDSLGGIDRIAGDLHELGDRAAGRGLRVGYEALAWGRHINDYRDAWEAVRRADHPPSAWCSTAFISWRAKPTSTRCGPFPETGSSSCSSPTLRFSTWTISPGAAISATFPAGRSARARLHGSACRYRLSGFHLARDLQ